VRVPDLDSIINRVVDNNKQTKQANSSTNQQTQQNKREKKKLEDNLLVIRLNHNKAKVSSFLTPPVKVKD